MGISLDRISSNLINSHPIIADPFILSIHSTAHSPPRHRRRLIRDDDMERPRHPSDDVRRRVRDAACVRVLRDQVRDAPRHPAPLASEQECARCVHYQLVSCFCLTERKGYLAH